MNKKISAFHNEDLVDGLLGVEFFTSTLKFCNIQSLAFGECLGYQRPLFLGGKNAIENYEKQRLNF